MNKSSFLNNTILTRANIAALAMLGMVGGFLVSTALSSISIMIFGANALWGHHPRLWLRNKWWIVGMVWVLLYALTWLWSDDKHEWEVRFQVKLAVLLLPLSFSLLPRLSAAHIRVITAGIGLFLFSGCIYSVSFLFTDGAAQLDSYRVSGLLPTPCSKDHIRFSLSIVFYLMWAVYIWPALLYKPLKIATAVLMVLMAAYIHILAAKSGMLALYIFLAGWGLYVTIARKKLAGLIVIAAIPLFLFAAVKFFPTFRARLQYMDATWYVMTHGSDRDDFKNGNFGDVGRIISYDIALKLIKENPLAGVGTGDMMMTMKQGYDRWYPNVNDHARLLPHNQFLTVALGCGIPAAIVFAVWALLPLSWLRRNRQSFFIFLAWLLVFIQLMIEPVLEVQNGVFVCLFFLLLFTIDLDFRPVPAADK